MPLFRKEQRNLSFLHTRLSVCSHHSVLHGDVPSLEAAASSALLIGSEYCGYLTADMLPVNGLWLATEVHYGIHVGANRNVIVGPYLSDL